MALVNGSQILARALRHSNQPRESTPR